MRFGRTGGSAAAVPSGAAAQKDHHVAGVGDVPNHMVLRSGTDDGADLHPLGDVIGMVKLGDLAGGKADLVAVGAVAVSGGGDQLLLGQLTL